MPCMTGLMLGTMRSISNSGSINAGDSGIEASSDAVITNSGRINSTGECGITAGDNAVITNSGKY